MNSTDNNIAVVTISTRVNKHSTPVETQLTIDWNGMTPDDILALAQQSLVIKRQGRYRVDGIPTSESIRAVDFRIGTRAPRRAPSMQSQVNAMTDDQKLALIEQIRASMAK